MFKRGSRGIKITYDKKKVVPVTVNFKFRSGVSVQAINSSNLSKKRTVPAVCTIKMFKRGSRGIKITYDKKKVVPVTVNFKFRSGVSVQAINSSNLSKKRTVPAVCTIKMFKRGSRGIRIKYDKKKVVPVTFNFKFRSGVSVQAVVSSNFGSDNALNEIVILVQALLYLYFGTNGLKQTNIIGSLHLF